MIIIDTDTQCITGCASLQPERIALFSRANRVERGGVRAGRARQKVFTLMSSLPIRFMVPRRFSSSDAFRAETQNALISGQNGMVV